MDEILIKTMDYLYPRICQVSYNGNDDENYDNYGIILIFLISITFILQVSLRNTFVRVNFSLKQIFFI